MALVQKTITGTIKDTEGNPASGRVIFTSSYRLTDEDGNVVYVPTTIIATLVGGAFTAELAATNSPDITPSGWTWRITEDIDGQTANTWYAQIAHDATEPIDYASLSPVVEPPAVEAYATIVQLNAEAIARAAADAALTTSVSDLAASVVLKNQANALTNTFTWTLPENLSGLIINRTVDVDPDDSADMVQLNYKGERSFWLNESGLPRARVPSQAALGFAEVAYKLFEQAEGNADGIQIFGPSDGSTPKIRSRNGQLWVRTLTSTESISAPNINKGSWTDITIDSPTVPGRYVQSTGTAPNAFKAQARLEGTDRVYVHGEITVIGTGASGDVIGTMPVGMWPSHRAWLSTGASGGAVSGVEVTAAGLLISRRSSLTGFLSLDGFHYDL